MESIKSEQIKIVTPVGTRFRYSYLVTPDEYMGVEKWKTEAMIPVGTIVKVKENGKEVEHEATQYIANQLENLLEGWKSQLKAAYPTRTFTLTKNKNTGKPTFPWSFEEDYLILKLKKNVKGLKGNNQPIQLFKHDPASGQNLLMSEVERQTMNKISPEPTGQAAMLASGYDAQGNGVGIKLFPISFCFRDIVPWTGGGADDFDTTEPSSYEEKTPTATAADF